MTDALTLLTALALQAVTIQPATVPAQGNRSAIVHLDQAGMVHLAAESASGTACALVDHLRGPFAQSGRVGRTNCTLDLLLDAGDYQLRLTSKRKGKGKVKLSAVPFAEVNHPLVRLEPHRSDTVTVHAGEQASYWLHLSESGPVSLRVAGRTAGQVELWRSGTWVESNSLTDTRRHLISGTDIHEWQGHPMLEAGDYLLVVYGADVLPNTSGAPLDVVEVNYGFSPSAPEQTVTINLPALGYEAFELPTGPYLMTMARQNESTSPTSLQLLSEDKQGVAGGVTGTCQITAKTSDPQCLARTGGEDRHLAVITGAPGTRLALSWGRNRRDSIEDGDYFDFATALVFTPHQSGTYRVATHDLRSDPDAAPLGCMLRALGPEGTSTLIATDFLEISPERPLSRPFNFDGSSETVAFEVKQTQAYRIATSGERVQSCELLQFQAGQLTKVVAGTEPGSKSCNLKPFLSAGRYQLRLYGGTAGIEKLVIAKGSRDPGTTPTKTSCQFPSVRLEGGVDYRIDLTRAGEIGARGLVLRDLPLTLLRPLPLHLDVDQGLELPLASTEAIRVSGASGATFTCSRGDAPAPARDGVCDLPAGAGTTLVLKNSGHDPVDVVVQHPQPPVPLPPLVPFAPKLEAPPAIAEGIPKAFDFDRLGSHSVLFSVKQPGLYDVTTEGLLATACSIRTPIVASVAQDQSGGRGRNCLVSTYLRDGNYLLTVSTVGQSRGRGWIRVSRRSVHPAPSVAAGTEAFARVGANELVTQKLTVPKAGNYLVSTTALRGTLQCRLEDLHGWPIVEAPTACTGPHQLPRGSYVWMQLPMTVPSSRHTQLTRIVPPQLLSGSKPHAVALNTAYDVSLSKKGEDRFQFTTEADLDVHVALSNAMQGRLYSVAADGSKTAVEFIPPDLVPQTAAPAESEGGDEGMAPPDDSPPPPASDDAEAPAPQPEGGDGEEPQSQVADEPAIAATPTAPPPARPQVPAGLKVHLPAGSYELVTQHSRGDVNIRYRLQLAVDALAPGVRLVVNAPARIPLHVAHDGVLRFATSGDTDVRCRIFDSSGHLLHESSEHGDDWNCALAEPFRAGEYEAVIESETQVPGVTTVAVSMPKADDLGLLADGRAFKVGATAASATLPAETASGVQEVFLHSTGRFSCALTATDGSLLHEETDVTTCGFLRAAGGQPARLDVWTLDHPAAITASLKVRPLTERSGSTLPSGSAVQAMVPRAGRYLTATGILCLPASQTGVLEACGPEVSLAAGPTVFALLGLADAKLPLDEVVDSLGAPARSSRTLTSKVDLKRLRSERGLQLVAARSPAGEKAGPLCQIEGGVSSISDRSCFAASGVTESSLLSLRSSGLDSISTVIESQAIPYPSAAAPLPLSRSELVLAEGGVGRFTPPSGAWRVDLTLAPHSWVVQINGQGAATDLCRPEDNLQACELEGVGGELLVVSPESGRFEALTQVLDIAPAATPLTSRFELRAGLPGKERLRIATADSARLVDVEGASRCQVRLDDGSHFELCHAAIPARKGALLRIEHGADPILATVHGPTDYDAVRFGSLGPASSATALPVATFVSLGGERVERSINLPHDAVVHVLSTGGVCALAQGSALIAEGGVGAGCDLYRSLRAGTYRLEVRRFADAPLAGQVDWTSVDVEELAEGIGTERWLAPGERRFFHFHTASAGQIGVGMQAPADVLDCSVAAADQTTLGEGCQEFLTLPAGDYLLSVRAPEHGTALRFRPVVLGLTGATMDVPEDYLRDFFARAGAQP